MSLNYGTRMCWWVPKA